MLHTVNVQQKMVSLFPHRSACDSSRRPQAAITDVKPLKLRLVFFNFIKIDDSLLLERL